VHQLDKQREAFYHRYWPKQLVGVEAFTLTINMAMVGEERAVDSAIPLILPNVRVTSERITEPELATL
jgi:hypothetical protein